jgi:DNA-directed RNA polymerase subunit L
MAPSTPFRAYAFDPKDPTQRHHFEIHGVDLAIVHALRRILLSDVPILGIASDDVEIVRYTGPGHNEILQHRISMLPIHFSEADTDQADPDDFVMLLHKTNTGSAKAAIHASDFEVRRKDRSEPVARLFPPNPITHATAIVTFLRPGEEIHLRANVKRGTARALGYAFSPVSLAVHTPMPDTAAIPPNAGPLERERAYQKNEYGEPSAFHFHIEIENGLSCGYLVRKALEILAQRIRRAAADLQSEVPDHASVHLSGSMAEFVFHGEDDTFGNVFQSLAYNRYLREKQYALGGRYLVSYVGYNAPHPLEAKIAVKARLVPVTEGGPEPSLADYRMWFVESATAIAGQVEELLDAWKRFMKV